MRSWTVLLAVLVFVPTSALMQEKGGEDEFGPYEVVANWPQQIPGTEGYTWGSTGGIFAETPDRVWIVQRGMLLDRNNNPITLTTGQPGSYTRVYQYPNLAPITGYNDPIYGQSGLEASMDEYGWAAAIRHRGNGPPWAC